MNSLNTINQFKGIVSLKIVESSIPGCREVFPDTFYDERGAFIKTFHIDAFKSSGLEVQFKEEYFSISKKGVLRGLHFQIPPEQHDKLVACILGRAFDVVVDLRLGSPTFGKHAIFKLEADSPKMIYIPSGLAHGFYAYSDQTIMYYKVTSSYSPSNDTGILWDSVDIPWPDKNPLLSERDQSFKPFSEFKSPFKYKTSNENIQ